MKKLMKYLRGFRRDCVMSPLFKLLEATLELFVPLVMASIIDRGIGVQGGDKPYIYKMCGLLVVLGLVGLVCAISAQYFAARAAVGFSARIKSELFRRIQSLSYQDLDNLGTSTLITRLTSDINQVQTGVNLVLRLVLRSPFVVFGAMIMAFTVDTQAALVFAVAIPVLSAAVFGIMLICIPFYRKVQHRLDAVLLRIRENLSGVRVLRAFCKQPDEKKRFERQNADLTAANIFVGRISAIMNPLTYVIVNLAIVALVYIGGVRVNSGSLTQGEVVALYNYMSQILVELVKLANLIITVTKSFACADRLSAVLDTQPSMQYGQSGITDGDIEFRGVSLRYDGAGDDILTDINFTAPAGSTVGIIGGTGSGKSSLINLIPRFYDATEGQVLIGGTDVRDMSQSALREHIGVVPQRAALFAGTIRDNLRLGCDVSDEQLMQAAQAAQAADIIASKEGGLDAVIEQHGRNLSGGQRQRLTVARALARQPRVLILDDSASALDYATDAALREAIRNLPWHPTVFIVSQRASSVRGADMIVVLDDGRVADIGTSEQLLGRCELYREIYYTQYERQADNDVEQ
ncbi:MAG: ABC transporter ATP-binding protein [Firmicutes bacterium]|nr:ABC transporter ATP-binding protein [Bacillota bacterium]